MRNRERTPWLLAIWVITGLVIIPLTQGDDQYLKQVKPVLQERCYACHGALKQEAHLRLDTAAAAIRGGDEGVAIQAGNPDASSLMARITATDLAIRMPPEGEPLKPEQVAAIRQWIATGAPVPETEKPEADPQEHWAFRPPVRPPVPTEADPAWQRNPIDAFIAAQHAEHGLTPQPLADKRVWLRRVSLDLIGLPPTAAEQAAFLADQSDSACDTVVTRLLDSPQYGERWGRHWMDVWRYSDWWGLGAEVRNSQKHIWHWRDWIIESLNADKGYDQMLREMLAADELYPNDLDKLRAGGFLARQYFKFNRTSWLDETIEHTSKAMLGMTFNCAKCHDHKYDPISQVEYYQMRAIFEPYQVRTDAVPGVIDFEVDGIPRPFDCHLGAETFVHLRGDDRNPDKTRVIEPMVPAFLSVGEWKPEAVALPREATLPGTRPFVVEAHRQVADQRVTAAQAALKAVRQRLMDAEAPAPVPLPAGEAPVLVSDHFATARQDLWEPGDGQWTYADGRLKQTQVGTTRAVLRLRQQPPVDFEARLKYVPTGGTMWKSVGMTFDTQASGYEALAYLSSYADGPKAQIAYKQGGNYAYPAEGAQTRSVDLNAPHEMILRVRGTLVNLTVDGAAAVAYRLPKTRQPGALQIITFDAQAEFLAFELRELPASVPLLEPRNAPPSPSGAVPLDQLRMMVQLGEKSLATAEAQRQSVLARGAADQARTLEPPPSDLHERWIAAARTEKAATAAQREEELSQAELSVLQATPEQKADRETKRTAAQAAREQAIKALESPGETYTSLPGALKTLENNLETEESRRQPFPTSSTGRRSAMARWITDARHPLPARVAVNHIWSRHLGRPLVPTVFDFGRKGTPPTHSELLDWLAVEFRESGWSMKHLHRLIVTSRTYRMSSSNRGAAADNLRHDPENRFYWRAHPVRMEAQTVRDSLLHLAGELDMRLGGPSIPVSQEDSRRRSLYFVHSHNEHEKFLSMFDDASVLDCYRRTESIVPQQALALENSILAAQMAEKIAARLSAAAPMAADTDWIRAAFVTVLSCEPTAEELAISLDGLARLGSGEAARAQFLLALLNHNDFVTVR
ncbi:MAG: DUF1553 domain-containing protein [Planctomycetota bacterium]|nr:MAG: DUF1553 domain-containing protein [Planctomycetota bacterium]